VERGAADLSRIDALHAVSTGKSAWRIPPSQKDNLDDLRVKAKTGQIQAAREVRRGPWSSMNTDEALYRRTRRLHEPVYLFGNSPEIKPAFGSGEYNHAKIVRTATFN
jgi:hypothetical protein